MNKLRLMGLLLSAFAVSAAPVYTPTPLGLYPKTNLVRGSNYLMMVTQGNSNGQTRIATVDSIMSSINIVAPNYLYVHMNGNDATAVKGNPLFAWRTLTAAVTNAVAGDTIGVYPGKYLGTNVGKNLVNWWFETGAEGTNLGVLASTFASAMFHDYSGAITSCIAGNGVFTMDYETNILSIDQSAILALSNGNSRVAFESDRINVRHFTTTDTFGCAFNIVNCGLLDAEVKMIYDPDLDRLSFDPQDPESQILSRGVGINWVNGECYFRIPQMYLESGRAVVGTAGVTNTLYYTGDAVKTYTDAFTANSTSADQVMWLEVKNVFAQYAALNIAGKGKFYFNNGQKVGAQGGGFGNAAVKITGNPQTWITLQKLTSFASPDPDFVDISGGVNFIRIQNYEQDILGSGVTTLGPAITITGGTNTFEGGTMNATNVIGFKLSGAHRTLIKDMTVQIFDSNPSGTGDTNWPVMNTTNGLVFQNTSLRAPNANVKAYWNSNAINVASVDGVLFLNTTTNAPARFTNGIVASGGVTKFFP